MQPLAAWHAKSYQKLELNHITSEPEKTVVSPPLETFLPSPLLASEESLKNHCLCTFVHYSNFTFSNLYVQHTISLYRWQFYSQLEFEQS